jgi:hypothetical protein
MFGSKVFTLARAFWETSLLQTKSRNSHPEMNEKLEAFLAILILAGYFALVIFIGRWLKVDALLWVILAMVPLICACWREF